MGLSPILLESLFTTILEIDRQGTTVQVVEQNSFATLEIAHRGYVLQTGKIVFDDTAVGLKSHDRIKIAYLGIAL